MLIINVWYLDSPDSKVRGANMGPIWGRQDPGGPNVGPMNIAIWEDWSQETRWHLLHDGNIIYCDHVLIIFLTMASYIPVCFSKNKYTSLKAYIMI